MSLGNWPEEVRSALFALHEHAYFKWATAARVTRAPKCPQCSRVLPDELEFKYRGLSFCTDKCRGDFERHVERQARAGAPS